LVKHTKGVTMRAAVFSYTNRRGRRLAVPMFAAGRAALPPGARAVALSMLWMVRRRLRRSNRQQLTA
jgi:hypothetical protein